VESKWLEDFVALSEYGSFTKAAEARFVTQPAFSRRIKALENWLGIRLVDRDTYPARLTKAGEQLTKDIYALLDQTKLLQKTARTIGNDRPHITVATQHALSVSVYPLWAMSLNAKLSDNTTLQVNAGNMYDCVDQFLGGATDFLLCYQSDLIEPPFSTEGLEDIFLGYDQLELVARDTLLEQSHYNDLMPLISFPDDSFFGKVIQAHNCLTPGQDSLYAALQTAFVTALSESAVALVKSGAGAGWLPRSLITQGGQHTLQRLPGIDPIRLGIHLYARLDDKRALIRQLVEDTKANTLLGTQKTGC
jgi:DNA-binding transcriptional LysR family regulator